MREGCNPRLFFRPRRPYNVNDSGNGCQPVDQQPGARDGYIERYTHSGIYSPWLSFFMAAERYSCLKKQFSQDVVNHLADASASSEVSTDRQSTLDAHIRSRIQGEIQRLRQEEEGVRKEIQNVLEKEVLALDGDVARSRDSETDEPGAPLNSIVLLGDVEEVKQKVDKYHTRLSSGEADTMKSTASALLTCYK